MSGGKVPTLKKRFSRDGWEVLIQIYDAPRYGASMLVKFTHGKTGKVKFYRERGRSFWDTILYDPLMDIIGERIEKLQKEEE